MISEQCCSSPCNVEVANGCFGLGQGLVDLCEGETSHRPEEMPAKVMILAQSGHGYYIRGTLKRLTDVMAWLKARWIRMSVKQVTDQESMPLLPRRRGNALKSHDFGLGGSVNPCHSCLAGEEMPAKVMILAQFDHGYYIRGTLKRLTMVVACLKAWWICVSVKEVTDQKSMPPLPWWRGNAHKSHDFGSVWPWILYPWDFEETDGCFGLPQGLVDPCERETSHRPEIHAPIALAERKFPQKGNARKSHDFGSIWPRILYPWDFAEADRCRGLAQGLVDPYSHCPGGEEMPTKVMILAQFDHGYYIRGTLKKLMGALAWLKAWWIYDLVDPYSHCPGGEEMPTKVMILAQFDHGYYIRGTLKRLMGALAWLKAWWIYDLVDPYSHCPGGEEMPTKVMILAQFDHGYYIRGTLKRLMGALAWLKAWWICTRNPCHCCLAGEEMPTKVMILAQFDHGYYIRGTLQRLTDVVAWLKAWWICVSVKQVTDQKSMPLLPCWGGKVVILAQFGHRYYIRGTLK
ncbi:hypothetical protein C8R44DRAFT_736297 [Mycena epipterygia]|nr:hypothetical protein C8R44DRAFT_736297 [Mycena epipterygia]